MGYFSLGRFILGAFISRMVFWGSSYDVFIIYRETRRNGLLFPLIP